MFKLISSLVLLALPAWAATCPPNQVVDGRQCTVTCQQDRPGGDFAAQYTGSFQGCINACAANAKCLTAQYHESNGYCYLKNSINPATASSGTDSVVCGAAGSTTSKSTSTSTTLATSKATTNSPASTSKPTSASTTTQTTSTSTTSTVPSQPTFDSYGCQTGNVTYAGNNLFIDSCNAAYLGTVIEVVPGSDLEDCRTACYNTPSCVAAGLRKDTLQCALLSDLTKEALGQPDYDFTLLLAALDPDTGNTNTQNAMALDPFAQRMQGLQSILGTPKN